jgi:FAD/FMN-containing dehydrogenase
MGVKHHFIGLHGLAVDNVEAFRLVTADGRIMDLNDSSTGEELSLFKVLNGAGLGYGVVTSITMKVYPLSNLGMENNEFITRRLIFSAPEISDAAEALTAFSHPSPNLIVAFAIVRAPTEHANGWCAVGSLSRDIYRQQEGRGKGDGCSL